MRTPRHRATSRRAIIRVLRRYRWQHDVEPPMSACATPTVDDIYKHFDAASQQTALLRAAVSALSRGDYACLMIIAAEADVYFPCFMITPRPLPPTRSSRRRDDERHTAQRRCSPTSTYHAITLSLMPHMPPPLLRHLMPRRIAAINYRALSAQTCRASRFGVSLPALPLLTHVIVAIMNTMSR